MRVDEDKIIALFKRLEIPVEELDSVAEDPHPDWYSYQSFDAATVDFGDFSEGATVTLHDCTAAQDEVIKRHADKGPKDGTLDLATCAALLAGHLGPHAEFTDSWATVMRSNPPAPKAAMSEWLKYAGALSRRVISRLVTGALLFRREEGRADDVEK